jgi:hypothetical protein
MFGDYIEAFHSDLESVVQFTGVAILVLGFSNFIWYVLEGELWPWLTPKGSHSNVLWATTGPHSLDVDLLWKQYMEGKGEYIWQFYGSLRVSIDSKRENLKR